MRSILLVLALIATCGATAPRNPSPPRKGKPVAPVMSLKTVDEKTVNLPGPRGKVVLIDYWATWCGPCRMELPHTQELADNKDLAARGLVVLAIDKEETADKVKPFLEKNHYTFTVPMDVDHKFGETYPVHGLPCTFVIGRDGTIRNTFVGYGPSTAPKIEEAIDEALKQPPPK